jgi:hypothetical protein
MAPKRRTDVLYTNEVLGAAQDAGVGLVTAQSGRGEGALLAERARLDVLVGHLLDLVLVGRVNGRGHDRVRVGRGQDGEGRGERGGGYTELHDLR